MKKILRIENLDCPVCAGELQEELREIAGVKELTVDYLSQTIVCECENEEALAHIIERANHFEEVRVLEEEEKTTKESHFKEWLLLGVSFILLVGGLLFSHFGKGRISVVISYILYGGAYLSVGYPVLLSTVKNIAKGRIFDENFLMTVASIGAILLGEIFEGVIVMFLYSLGELLQAIAVGSSRKSVTKLMEMKTERAILLQNGEQKTVRPEELQVGDIVLVKAGEKTPTDGILLSETAVLDTKALSGEFELKTLKKGEEILSGCINAGSVYEMRVTRPYQDSAVGKILDMVENVSQSKAKPEKFITKFARIYTPVVCCLALVIAIIVPLVSGLIIDGELYFRNFSRWANSALTFLVVSCPCALVISVPLTYFSGIGMCAKNGILVKGATYLDVLAKAKTVAFDKTGTLTKGDFTILNMYPEKDVTEKELLSVVSALEKNSSHPIAKAFIGAPDEYVANAVKEVAGKGLLAEICGEKVFVGNYKFLNENGIAMIEKDSFNTMIYAAKGGKYLGCIEIGDALREGAQETISQLKELGARSVMLTGDKVKRAQNIANEIGMYEVKAELLPDGKLTEAQKLQEKGALVYIGDGINDAPVMTVADCAVSMGKLGSSAAVEASDLVLISDNLKSLVKAFKISKKTRRIVTQNIVFSIFMKVVFMILGVLGLLPLYWAVFADVGVMLLAVCNSFRVRNT